MSSPHPDPLADMLTKPHELDGKFESQAKTVTTCISDAALTSIAVSLKRIADALDGGQRDMRTRNPLVRDISPTFKKFGDLTNDQQFAVTLMHPSWDLDHLRRFEYRITKKGDLSRKKGDHRPTVDWSREIDRILGTPVESSASTGPTATRDQPIRRTGIHPMHLGSNRD